jgi:hypothetical protein
MKALLCPKCNNLGMAEITTDEFYFATGYKCPSCGCYMSFEEYEAHELERFNKIQEDIDNEKADYDAACGAGEAEAEAEERYYAEMESLNQEEK